MKKLLTIILLTLSLCAFTSVPVLLTGCDNDSPVEEAVEETGDTIEDAGDEAQDAMDEVEDEM